MRTIIPLAIAVVVLALAGAAQAIDPVPPATPAFGRVEILKDRRAGALEDVRKESSQVSYVRGGSERPMRPGLALHEGDAIRTADGVCVVVSDGGLRVEIGERSQVRLERGVLQRLGEVYYQAPGDLSVRADDVELATAGAGFKLVRDLAGAGQVVVREGEVRVRTPGGESLVEPGSLGSFDQEAAGEVRVASKLELEAIDAWRAARFRPGPAESPTRRDQALIRLEGGVSWFEDLEGWGRGGLEGHIRLHGPLWMATGAAFAGRRGWELEDSPNVFAVPIHLGLRLTGDLPRSFFISGGADFQLVVMGQCDDQTTCTRRTVAHPGGRLLIGGGLLLSRRFGLDLEFSGGVLRRQIPPVLQGGEATDVVDPQFHLSVGFFLRI